jgi:hypothetical protein
MTRPARHGGTLKHRNSSEKSKGKIRRVPNPSGPPFGSGSLENVLTVSAALLWKSFYPRLP